MTQASLGALLAQQQKEEQESATRQAQHQQQVEHDKAAKKREALAAFFNRAQEHFTQSILSQVSTAERRLTIGQTPRKRENVRIGEYLGLAANTLSQEHLLNPSHPFFEQIDAFYQWARSQNLEVLWNYEHDGVGLHGWYTLDVAPASN